MGWLGRIFDRRDTLARMLLLDIAGLGYLFLGKHDGPPGVAQLVLAGVAFALALSLFHWPLAGFVAQAALLVVSYQVLDDPTISQVGSSWALAELTIWAPRLRTAGFSAAALLAIYVVCDTPGSSKTVTSAIYGLILPIGLPLLLGAVIRTTRELSTQAQRRAEAEQQQRELESRAARSDERTMIARELHDVVAHHVASMVLRAGVARHVVPDIDPRLAAVLDDVHGTGTAALADLRRLVAVLRDDSSVRPDAALTAIEPGSLPAALGAAVDTARRAGLTVEADIDDAVGRLDAVRGLAVLRLTQEALTNVAKHAGTTARARLHVAVADGTVTWEVADDGGGVSAQLVPPGGGHGLTGMRERVEVLGGVLTAGPSGEGWRVHTVLPAATS